MPNDRHMPPITSRLPTVPGSTVLALGLSAPSSSWMTVKSVPPWPLPQAILKQPPTARRTGGLVPRSTTGTNASSIDLRTSLTACCSAPASTCSTDCSSWNCATASPCGICANAMIVASRFIGDARELSCSPNSDEDGRSCCPFPLLSPHSVLGFSPVHLHPRFSLSSSMFLRLQRLFQRHQQGRVEHRWLCRGDRGPAEGTTDDRTTHPLSP